MIIQALAELGIRLDEHLPSSEAGVREVLAQAIRAALDFSAGEVEVESPAGRKRIDVWIHPTSTAIEVKFHRQIPSGHNRPMTVQYGQVLADIRKLASVERALERVLVLLADGAGMTHLINKALIPARVMDPKQIRAEHVNGLAKSASGPALAEGPWIPVTMRLIWQHRLATAGVTGLAWAVTPLPATA